MKHQPIQNKTKALTQKIMSTPELKIQFEDTAKSIVATRTLIPLPDVPATIAAMATGASLYREYLIQKGELKDIPVNCSGQ